MAARRITIFDTTLRDGEQSPGIALQPHEKAEIATQLERLGVDVVEAGFAVSSPGDFEGVRAVAAAVDRPAVASLARTKQGRHRRQRGGARRRAALPHPRLHRDEPHPHGEEAPPRARRGASSRPAGRSATPTRKADEVEFSCEDATRSDPRFVAKVCREAIEAGATTINLPDTVGYCLPDEYASFLLEIQHLCPELEEVSLSVHCHNDLGLAVANSLAAVRAGATQIEATINGLGERAGNAALEEIVMALRVAPRLLRDRDRHRRRRDRQDLASRREADGLQRPALQGDRGRERVRPRGRHPPGRDAEGRRRRTRSWTRPSSGS